MWSVKRVEITDDGETILVVNIDSPCCRGIDYRYIPIGEDKFFCLSMMETCAWAVNCNLRDAWNEYRRSQSS